MKMSIPVVCFVLLLCAASYEWGAGVGRSKEHEADKRLMEARGLLQAAIDLKGDLEADIDSVPRMLMPLRYVRVAHLDSQCVLQGSLDGKQWNNIELARESSVSAPIELKRRTETGGNQ